MIRKNIYRWHRMASLIIAIPVLAWAISGFMHPLMTNVRPKMAINALTPPAIDSAALKVSLDSALQQNNISSFHNVRLISIDTNWFYQVQLRFNEIPVYLSVNNGRQLRSGDALYAQHIARQFLEGQPEPVKKPVQYASLKPETDLSEAGKTKEEASAENASHDCCEAATACVLFNSKGSRAISTELQTDFSKEYKSINRLLPVYRVAFNRADSIRVYVETTQDRFAFAMDSKREFFDGIFATFHTWDWLDRAGNTKLVLMGIICTLGALTTIMGLYIFFTTKTKKGSNPLVKSRRTHRYVSLVASLFTLMFTISGGWHALDKLKAEHPVPDNINNDLPASVANIPFSKLAAAIGEKPVSNISLARVDTVLYWRVISKGEKRNITSYVHAGDYSLLPNGDEQYARSLAAVFSGQEKAAIKKAELVTKFSGEYGFVNKRLPVWKISYASNSNERYYVETGTARLAAHVTDRDTYEGYSFAFFHKHHFMDWGGKGTRDISTMVAAALQILMVVVGLILFFRWRARRSGRRQPGAPPVNI